MENLPFDKRDFSYLQIDFSYQKIEAACSSETSKQTHRNILCKTTDESIYVKCVTYKDMSYKKKYQQVAI
jgi:hypothetical protein